MENTTEQQMTGDINSSRRGSGARLNSGKPEFEFIPYKLILKAIDGTDYTPEQEIAIRVFGHVAAFQDSGEVEHLHKALKEGFDYLPDCAKVFAFGAKKYAAWNWTKGMLWSVPLACIGRHFWKIIAKNEHTDEESGVSHLGHILCNIVMLATFHDTFPEGNVLPPRNFAPESDDSI